MAYATTDTTFQQYSKRSRLAAPFRRITSFFNTIIQLQNQARQMEQFARMSDRELALRGLSRETFVQHVLTNSAAR